MASNTVLAKLAVVISANAAEFNKAMQQSNRGMQIFQKGFSNLTSALGVGLGLNALVSGFRDVVGIAQKFEATMSTVRAITNATSDEFKKLEKDALKLGASTKFTASQVGELQINYGRLGFTTKEILNATKATLSLAAATGEDLAKSADVAGATIRGFELDASQTIRVVDVMASSFNKTALGLENFTESMKYVAPVANAAGATVEETTALLGVLADAGIRGSMAGTSLRKIFTDLTNDGRPLSVRLDELAARGITLSDSMDEVGRTAQTSLLILSKNRDKTNELTSAFRNAGGEAERVAKIMEDNLQGDVTKLTSAWEGLVLAFTNTKAYRSAVQGLTDILNTLNYNSDTTAIFNNALKRLNFELDYYKKVGATKDNNPEAFALLGKQVERVKELADQLGIRLIKLKDEGAGIEKFLVDTRTLPKNTEQVTKAVHEEVKVRDANLEALREEAAMKTKLADINRRLTGRADPATNALGTSIDIAPALERAKMQMKQFTNAFKSFKAESDALVLDLSGSISGAISDIAMSIGEAFSGGEDFGKSFLKILSNFCAQVGSAAIALGITMLNLRAAFATPGAAIAAGVALLAVAGALGAASKAQDNFNRGASSSSSGGVSRSNQVRINRSQSEIILNPELIVSGANLKLVLKNQDRIDNRTGQKA